MSSQTTFYQGQEAQPFFIRVSWRCKTLRCCFKIIPVIMQGKFISTFTTKVSACFMVYLKTYSPKFSLVLVPIGKIILGKAKLMLELWLVGAQFVAPILYSMVSFTLSFPQESNPLLSHCFTCPSVISLAILSMDGTFSGPADLFLSRYSLIL